MKIVVITVFGGLLFNSCSPKQQPNVNQKGADTTLFFDDFEGNLSKWDVNYPHKAQIVNKQNNKVLRLEPGAGDVYALIKGSENWNGFSIEGDVLFPEDEHNYMGFVYNYTQRQSRVDYGCIYIKGNGSYIRVNPHRDALVSRTLYEEYKTPLEGQSAITIGEWQHFKAEVIGNVCHFYVGDMTIPKVTFKYLELSNGKVGFEPRIFGSEVWVDNILVNSMEHFSYSGKTKPDVFNYPYAKTLNNWQAIGPFRNPQSEIIDEGAVLPNKTYKEGISNYKWSSFNSDKRGCVVTGKLFEFASDRIFSYFHTKIISDTSKKARLVFSGTNKIAIYLNGKEVGQTRPLYEAWYDFLDNPEREKDVFEINLLEGGNELLLFVESVQEKYNGDGFFAGLVYE